MPKAPQNKEFFKDVDSLLDFIDVYLYGCYTPQNIEKNPLEKSLSSFYKTQRIIQNLIPESDADSKSLTLNEDSYINYSNPFSWVYGLYAINPKEIYSYFEILKNLGSHQAGEWVQRGKDILRNTDPVKLKFRLDTLRNGQIIKEKIENPTSPKPRYFYQLIPPVLNRPEPEWKFDELEKGEILLAVEFYKNIYPISFTGTLIAHKLRKALHTSLKSAIFDDEFSCFYFPYTHNKRLLNDSRVMAILWAKQKKCLISFDYNGKHYLAAPLALLPQNRTGIDQVLCMANELFEEPQETKGPSKSQTLSKSPIYRFSNNATHKIMYNLNYMRNLTVEDPHSPHNGKLQNLKICSIDKVKNKTVFQPSNGIFVKIKVRIFYSNEGGKDPYLKKIESIIGSYDMYNVDSNVMDISFKWPKGQLMELAAMLSIFGANVQILSSGTKIISYNVDPLLERMKENTSKALGRYKEPQKGATINWKKSNIKISLLNEFSSIITLNLYDLLRTIKINDEFTVTQFKEFLKSGISITKGKIPYRPYDDQAYGTMCQKIIDEFEFIQSKNTHKYKIFMNKNILPLPEINSFGEVSFLKNMAHDESFSFLLSNGVRKKLQKILEKEESLLSERDWQRNVQTSSIQNQLRKIMESFLKEKVLSITTDSQTYDFIPCKLQYDEIFHNFHLIGKNAQSEKFERIPVDKISAISITDTPIPIIIKRNFMDYLEQNSQKSYGVFKSYLDPNIQNRPYWNPITQKPYQNINKKRGPHEKLHFTLKLFDARNSVPRCYALFSGCRKEVTIDDDGVYTMTIYYYKFDEEEMIQRILSLTQYAIVESPGKIKQKVIRELQKMQAYYTNIRTQSKPQEKLEKQAHSSIGDHQKADITTGTNPKLDKPMD